MTATTPTTAERFSYLLIDGALLADVKLQVKVSQQERPSWLIPLYLEEAVQVSPWLIDIGCALRDEALEEVMNLANALRPQLHLSVIDSQLEPADLVHHLRHFIFVFVNTDEQRTLRFADCVILPVLRKVFTLEQWKTFTGPIDRWLVHDRAGAMVNLVQVQPNIRTVPPPLVLSGEQQTVLEEATEPDSAIAWVRNKRLGDELPGSVTQQHQWASTAHSIWRNVGRRELTSYYLLTLGFFDTLGSIAEHRELSAIMLAPDIDTFRLKLTELVERVRSAQELVS
ncbi:MAG: DUF4123 domain-containing protein [Pseudomonadota bacterium]